MKNSLMVIFLTMSMTGSISPLMAGQVTMPVDDALDPTGKILPDVTIKGTFVQWADKTQYKTWMVSVSRVRHDQDPKIEKFPVAENGSFEFTLHNMPVGSGYYLHSNAGDQPFGITSANIYISTIGPD